MQTAEQNQPELHVSSVKHLDITIMIMMNTCMMIMMMMKMMMIMNVT